MDDLYVNDGATYEDTAYYAPVDEEREQTETSQASIKAASYPIMGDIEQWFREQIEATDSRTAVVQYATLNKLPKETVGEAFDIVRTLLEAKYQEFKDFRNE